MFIDKTKVLEAAGGEFAIYQRYLPGLTEAHISDRKKNVSSCFSKDNNPSLSVYKRGEKLLFKCHSTGKQGSVFEFFAENEGINSKDFPAILKAMNEKLGLGLNSLDLSPVRSERWNADYYPEFTAEALAYWQKFGVGAETLTRYQVRQLSLLTYQGENNPSKFRFGEAGQLAFEYRVNGRYKLYVPKQEGIENKYFIKTQTNDDVFGLEQLPKDRKVPILLICEGEKDALCANALGLHAVSFQSANIEVTVNQIRKLFDRACDLIICYDTDEAGIKASKKLSRIHLIPFIKLEDVYKDLAEYLPGRSVDDFESLIDEEILKFKRFNNMLIREYFGSYFSLKKKKTGGYSKVAVTNFTLEVDAFISSVTESKRIIRIRDAATGHLTEPFSVHTDDFTGCERFRKMLESKGNFFFSGGTPQLLAIKKHCFRLAGIAEEVPHLGYNEYQGKTCFVLSNSVWLDGRWQYPDRFGIVEGLQIPSAAFENRYNEAFSKDRSFKYEPNEKTSLPDWINDLAECYGVFPAILGFSFILATMYFDHISSKRSAFPLLMVWGQKGSGKNSFLELLMALFGSNVKHDAMLSNATPNSLNKLHEQRANIPVWMDEFKNSIDSKLGIIERLKGLFDLVGRSKAVDSSNRTKSSQIKTSTIVSGQEFPTDEALLSRCLMLEFQVFENEEKSRKRFTEAKARCTSGLGHLIPALIAHRSAVVQDFQAEFVRISSELTRSLDQVGIQVNSRIIDNYASILSPLVISMRNGLKIFHSQSSWENEYADLLKMFAGAVENQARMESKMDEVAMFWECFLRMADGAKKLIHRDTDFVIKDNKFGFRGRVLDEFQRYYRSINGKEGVNKDAVIRYMARRNYYQGENRMYFDGKQQRCYVCNLDLMPEDLRMDLNNAFSFSVNRSGHATDSSHQQQA